MTQPRRALYAAGLLTVLLGALLVAWFISGWADVRGRQRTVRDAPRLAAEQRGAELAHELRGELGALMSREVDRPYFHYQNLFHDPLASAGLSVAPSPLARGPDDALVLGYFQLDAGGRTTTPTLNDELPELSEPKHLAGNRRFRDEVTRSLAEVLAPHSAGPLVAVLTPSPPTDRTVPRSMAQEPRYERSVEQPAGTQARVQAQAQPAQEQAPAQVQAQAQAPQAQAQFRLEQAQVQQVQTRPPQQTKPQQQAQAEAQQPAQVVTIDSDTYVQNNWSNSVYRTQQRAVPRSGAQPQVMPKNDRAQALLDATSQQARAQQANQEPALPPQVNPQQMAPQQENPPPALPQQANPQLAAPQPANPPPAVSQQASPPQAAPSANPQPANPQSVVPQPANPHVAVPQQAEPQPVVPTPQNPQPAVPEQATRPRSGRDPSRTDHSSTRPSVPTPSHVAVHSRSGASATANVPEHAKIPEPPKPITITVSPLEWRTLAFAGQPTVVAVRQVETPDGRLAQGFVVDRTALTSWLATHAGDAVAELRTGDNGTTEIVPGWHLDVEANPRVLVAAASEAAAVARGFIVRFVVVGMIALLAAWLVVVLVARAERLARERSQFAAAAAHELRTPLAGLQLYGDMLADGLGDPSKMRDYARRMSEEASRLGRVVSNVLGFSQLERGNLSVDPRTGALGEALCELAERAQPALDRAGAVLALDVAPELSATFDRDALARIVGNLLDNAEKYGRQAGDRTITLAARATGSSVEVVVSDHGPGIAQPARARLFQPFARGVTTDGPAGLGLGLALSQSLARAMGGDLAYRPGPGGGAAFVLTLARG